LGRTIIELEPTDVTVTVYLVGIYYNTDSYLFIFIFKSYVGYISKLIYQFIY
jgi:hypothetical protein